MKGTASRAPVPERPEPPHGSGEYRKSECVPSTRRVLVADPTGTLCEKLGPLLAEEGLELAIARDGKEALDRALLDSPELIISDTDLPHMNGMELCRAVRASAWLGRTPFVLLAATASREMLTMATNCGADLCLSKPVDPGRVVELVRALLR